MSQTSESRLYAVFAQVLGVDAATMRRGDTNLTVPGWDSVNHLQLLLAIEEAFGVEFDPEEFATLTSVDALLVRIEAGAS